jgi:integrase
MDMSIAKRKLKNGSFAFQATDRTPHFPSISRTLLTRREAREWLAAVRSERRRGLAFDPKQNASMSLGEAMQKYAHVVSVKKQGAGQELSMVRRWLRHPFANGPIGEILPVEFDEYVDARLASGVSASTILKELSFVSQVYGFVRKKLRMYAGSNPIPDVDKPSAAPLRSRRLSENEEAKLLLFFQNYGNSYVAVAFIFAIETGLRKSELFRLQWSDVDLAARWAIVQQAGKGRNPAT